MTDLNRYAKRQGEEIKKTEEGIRARKREEHLLKRVNQSFNY